MKERPIPFNGAMVRALLRDVDPKTQTRRVVRGAALEWLCSANFTPEYVALPENSLSPFGYAGDRLWVREAWRTTGDGGRADDMPPRDLQPHRVWYEADGVAPADECVGKYRPGMFMPHWASRLTLEVTGVRVERLQDVSEADAIAEGVESPDAEREERDWSICPQCGGTRLYDSFGPNLGVMPDTDCLQCDTHVKRYRHLWDSLNAERGYGWEANPWVWVVEFKRVVA